MSCCGGFFILKQEMTDIAGGQKGLSDYVLECHNQTIG